jgi:hypothetical protein
VQSRISTGHVRIFVRSIGELGDRYLEGTRDAAAFPAFLVSSEYKRLLVGTWSLKERPLSGGWLSLDDLGGIPAELSFLRFGLGSWPLAIKTRLEVVRLPP